MNPGQRIGPAGGKACPECGLTRWEGTQAERYLDSLRADLDQTQRELLEEIQLRVGARAEADRLRDLLGRLYANRGGDQRTLYTEIRRAYQEATHAPR